MRKIEIIKRRFQIGGALLFGSLFALVMLVGFDAKSSAVSDTADKPNSETAFTVNDLVYRTTVSEISTEPPTTEPDKHYYAIPLSADLQDYIFATADDYGVPPELIIAIIQKESDYRANATGAAGEQGYMQIHPVNFEWLSEELGITDFYDPEQNILAGTYMLSGLCEKYDTINEILMCYNCGEGGAKRLWKNGITETEYCRKIADIIQSIKKA